MLNVIPLKSTVLLSLRLVLAKRNRADLLPFTDGHILLGAGVGENKWQSPLDCECHCVKHTPCHPIPHHSSLYLTLLALFSFFFFLTCGYVYGMCVHRYLVCASMFLGAHGYGYVHYECVCGGEQRWALGISTASIHYFWK